jgi:hypothetical protein
LHSFLQNYGVYDEAPEDRSRHEQDGCTRLLQEGHEGGHTQGYTQEQGLQAHSPPLDS